VNLERAMEIGLNAVFDVAVGALRAEFDIKRSSTVIGPPT
jgi:hypothetical protein